MMRYSEMMATPNEGVYTVVDLSWHPKDRGLPWLVVERGHTYQGGFDLYSDTGRLVASCRSEKGAKNRAGRARGSLARQKLAGHITVVHRDSVRVVVSGHPYGCYTGSGTSA